MPTTLLAVDDSVTMRKVLEMTFAGEQDVRVVTAENVDGALAKFRSERAAIVLTDLTLDGQGGYGLCSRIKAESPSTPVILLSSKQQAYDPSKGAAARADDFVEKPFDTQVLIDKVRKLLGKTVEPVRQTGGFPGVAGQQPVAAGPAARSPFASTVVGQPARHAPPASVGPRPTAPAIAQAARAPGAAPVPQVPSRGAMPTRVGQPAPPAPQPHGAPAGGPQSPGQPHAPASASHAGAHLGAGAGSPSAGAVAPRFEAGPARGGAVQPIASGARAASPASLPSAASSTRSADAASPPPPAVAAAAGTAAASPGAASSTAAAASLGANGAVAQRLSELGLSETQVSAVLALSRDVVERVVWEVVPVLAETMIREEIKRLTSES